MWKALYIYRKQLSEGKESENELKYITLSAQHGYEQAQYELGMLYKSGKEVKSDPVEAIKWFEKAAEGGDASGQAELGIYLLEKGKNKEAFTWLQRAAEQYNFQGQLQAASCYLNGIGVEKDEERAIEDLVSLFYDVCLRENDVKAIRMVESVVPRSRLMNIPVVCIPLSLSLSLSRPLNMFPTCTSSSFPFVPTL